MTRRVVALVAVVVLTGTALLAGTVSPAGAESGSKRSERGDAPAAIDVTRLRVDNGDLRFTMRVSVRDLRDRGSFVFQYWRGRRQEPPPASVLVVVRRVEGVARARFFGCGREDCAPEPCRGMRAAWRRAADVVELSVPQRCYPHRDPDAEPPLEGRFFVAGQTPRDVDDGPRALLLARG